MHQMQQAALMSMRGQMVLQLIQLAQYLLIQQQLLTLP